MLDFEWQLTFENLDFKGIGGYQNNTYFLFALLPKKTVKLKISHNHVLNRKNYSMQNLI